MREQPGYYPGYSTLKQKDYWDETTRELVLNRVQQVPPLRFFDVDEAKTFRAVLDRIIPQDDRIPERRVPILHFVDQQLYEHKFPGYIYEGMPPEDQAHRLAARAFETMARELHDRSFDELSIQDQERILDSVRLQKPRAAREIWSKMHPGRYWVSLLHLAIGAYYSHPWAWDEIGFGGPAYPRGYMRLEDGKPEPWEVQEARYEWSAPNESISDSYRPLAGLFSGTEPP